MCLLHLRGRALLSVSVDIVVSSSFSVSSLLADIDVLLVVTTPFFDRLLSALSSSSFNPSRVTLTIDPLVEQYVITMTIGNNPVIKYNIYS